VLRLEDEHLVFGRDSLRNGAGITYAVARTWRGVTRRVVVSASETNDFGRARETGTTSDRFTFRTPTLLNVSATGPFLHSGAYDSLAEVTTSTPRPPRTATTPRRSRSRPRTTSTPTPTRWSPSSKHSRTRACSTARASHPGLPTRRPTTWMANSWSPSTRTGTRCSARLYWPSAHRRRFVQTGWA
jgi:hypothetical protein